MKKVPSWPIFTKKEINLVSKAVLKSNNCASLGKNVGFTSKFESKFAKYHKKKYGVACFNCTVGLEALLICAGVGPGDEVIVPAYTYISSVTSIIRVGGIPRFVDVNKDTLCTDLELIKKSITKKTKAIMLVHFGGYMSDIKKIKSYFRRKKIRVLEDAAQAHGAKRDGFYPGEIDAGAIFSFQRNKNMCSGEGGILLTNNLDIAKKFRQFIWHGTKPGRSNIHNFVGSNFRITEFQSAILLEQLKKLKNWNLKRMQVCNKIDQVLKNVKFIETNDQKALQVHARHLYSFRVKNYVSQKVRKKLIKNLNKSNIICSGGYSYPVYKSPIFKKKNFPKYFKKSNERVYKNWISYIDNLYLQNSEEVCKTNVIFPHFNFLIDNGIHKKIYNIIKKL